VIGEVTFGVIGLLLLFADVRTFASTFQQTFFGAPNTNLAIMAVSVFATSFLALLVSWRLGPRRALGIAGLLFAAATFLATTSRSNWIDLALSVIALAGGFWWMAFVHSARTAETGSPLARALPIAFACDLGLRAVFRTVPVVDLAWPVAVGIVGVAVLAFAALGLIGLSADRQWTAPDLRGILGLLVTPCLVLIAETGATPGVSSEGQDHCDLLRPGVIRHLENRTHLNHRNPQPILDFRFWILDFGFWQSGLTPESKI